jgi:predicted MFS family arabinose efflux permease
MKPFESYVFLRQNRYWIFSSVLFMLMVARTLTGFWTGDFWAHAAVVQELATNPLSPRHPQLLVEA